MKREHRIVRNRRWVMTLDQIAERLGLSKTTVESALRSGMRKLRENRDIRLIRDLARSREQ